MDRISAARSLLAHGWTPVPVARGAKKPFEEGWQQRTVTDADVPLRFSGNGNIGIVTGSLSGGLCDVDLDCAETVMLAERFLPATPMRSGHGTRKSSHWWYRIQGAIPATTVYKDVDAAHTVLVELRTDGHQTLVPPSVHPDGDAYEWYGDLDPVACDADALSRRVARLASAALLVRHWPRTRGSRHQIANALAGMLLRGGWTEAETERFIGTVADAAGDEESRSRARAAIATAKKLNAGGAVTGAPTLAELIGKAVVDRVVEWLRIRQSAESAQPQPAEWELPIPFEGADLPEFPVHVLPSWLREFVSAEATSTQTPLALAGGLALAACAVGPARIFGVRVRPDWYEPLNMFFVVVLGPGNRTTAVFSHVNRPLVDYEKSRAEALRDEISAGLTRMRILHGRVDDAEKKAAKATYEERDALEQEAIALAAERDAIRVLLAPRLFTDDATPERLAGLLFEHDGRFAVLSPEGGVFELLAGRYNANGAPNFDIFLKGHAGDPLRVDRSGRPPEHVNNPALTVGLRIQHDVLRGLHSKPGFRGRGLLARFLYAMPVSTLGHRQIGPPSVPEKTRLAFTTNLSALLRLRDTATPPSDEPRSLRLSVAAEQELRRFEVWIEPQLAPLGALAGIADWVAKLAGAVVRLAGVLHLATLAPKAPPLDVPIGVETVKGAIKLGRFYLEHAKAAFAFMGMDADVENARYVLAWIERRGITEFSERDAYKGTQGRFQKVADLRPALEILVDRNHIREIPRAPTSGAGRPSSPRYQVNPLVQSNSGDIGDSGGHSQKPNSDSSDGMPTPGLDPDPPTQNPHNPQNSIPPDDADDTSDDEVVL